MVFCPTHLSQNKSSTHSIYFPKSNVWIPYELHGMIEWLELTSSDKWDHYNPEFVENEKRCQENLVLSLVSTKPKTTNDILLLNVSNIPMNKKY